MRAPGRVNLIGDHTDYNDGLVLPVAIGQATFVRVRARDDRRLSMHAQDVGERAEADLDGPVHAGGWRSYVEGVARILLEQGFPLRGADLAVRSDLPMGSGLSSSAALTVGTALALLAVARLAAEPVPIARAVQETEHRFAGARVGIMDPLAILLGRAGCALLLDCRSLQRRHVPLRLGEHVFVLADSGVRHSIGASGYNTRRAECEEAVRLLGRRSLRDVGLEELPGLSRLLPDLLGRRVRHVVTENARTEEAAEALEAGDLGRAGTLMLQSHRSLREDYEVTVPELDRLVAAFLEAGALGARMTGGGFGGSVVALVPRDALREVRVPFRVVEASDGAREIPDNPGNLW
ncbi:MAG TPA: galactokinase [Candidatus Polarisedimenticolaceae bacterium]|nr:galactokinase [Candidatus Polarisedimenticolaceae bacterium]